MQDKSKMDRRVKDRLRKEERRNKKNINKKIKRNQRIPRQMSDEEKEKEIQALVNKSMQPEEYSILKSEIISLETVKQNYIITMYTITIAIIGFAVQAKSENLWVYLLPYIIFIPFQRIIDTKKYNSLKIAAVLALFSGDVWETHFNYIEDYIFQPNYEDGASSKKLFKSIIKKESIVRVSALHLGAVCSALCVIICVYKLLTKNQISVDFICLVILPAIAAVLLFAFLNYWCEDALDSHKTRDKYVDNVSKVKNREDISKEQRLTE